MSVAVNNRLNLGTDFVLARRWILEELGPVLARAGFRSTLTTDTSIQFMRSKPFSWVRSDTLIAELGMSDGYVIATVSGAAPKIVRSYFEKWNREGVVMRTASAPPPPPEAVPREEFDG